MRCKSFLFFFVFALGSSSFCWGSGFTRTGLQEQLVKIKEMLDFLRAEVRNLQEQQEILNEKFSLQEDVVEELQRLVRREREQTLFSLSEKTKERDQKATEDFFILKEALEKCGSVLQNQQSEMQRIRQDTVSQKKALESLRSALEALVGGSEERKTYVVAAGDSLGTIAKKFKLRISSLKEANGLKSDLIYPGQKLIIPK